VTGELRALMDFHLVTKWKTAGDSLLAASPSGAQGQPASCWSGQARWRVPWSRLIAGLARGAFTVWSRTRATAESMGLPVADDLEAAVKAADMICTCTLTKEPLIKGDWLQPGQHLDLIGAYKPAMREVDDTAMARARVFVDAAPPRSTISAS
jgi:ornithine cyclodeaminase